MERSYRGLGEGKQHEEEMTAEKSTRGPLPLISFLFLKETHTQMQKKAGCRVELHVARRTTSVTQMDGQEMLFGVTLPS